MHVLCLTAILNRIQVFHCKLIPNTIVITKLGRDSKSCKGSQNISTPIAIFYPPSDKYRGVIISRYTVDPWLTWSLTIHIDVDC